MRTTGTADGTARTYLTHIFGCGLDAQRYVVERFETMIDGEIRPYGAAKRARRGRKQARTIMSLRAVQRLKPQRNEIIIATGVEAAGGIQLWGDSASGLFVNGRRR